MKFLARIGALKIVGKHGSSYVHVEWEQTEEYKPCIQACWLMKASIEGKLSGAVMTDAEIADMVKQD